MFAAVFAFTTTTREFVGDTELMSAPGTREFDHGNLLSGTGIQLTEAAI
jgi:hypothetical protein